MALYATNRFAGDGVTTSYEFNFAGKYIARPHVKVYQEDNATGARTPIAISDSNFLNDTTLRNLPVTPVGKTLVIYRDTPKPPLVNFTNGARLTEANLDTATRQGSFIAVESADALSTDGLAGLISSVETARGQAAASAATATTKAAEALASAVSAKLANDNAVAAASAIGPIKFYDTYAQALGAILGLASGELIEVAQDETRAGARTRYKVQAGALVFVVNLDRDSGQSNRGAEITLKANSADSRYSVPSGLMGSIVVLGDSISHGAFVGNSYQDGWVNILKRMLNAETGGRGYGFTPLLTLGSGATLTQEVHDVNISGAWAATVSSTGGGDVLQGLSYTSSTAGDTITISCPTFQPSVRIWYIEDVGAGTFSYAVNGGAASNIVTAAATRNTAKSKLIPMEDNGAGKFSIVLTVVSGSVTLTGIGYETSPNTGAELAGNVVQNFSQSGRRLRYATEGMVDLASRGSVLILALGYNDSWDVETDPAYNTAFQQVIDWVIKYCLKYNTTLVVPDFCWWAEPANKARMGLKRAAFETRGIYIPLPDYLTRDQLVKHEFNDRYYMVDALKKWVDTAHPNKHGAKWIAETVAKAMGLSCTSKRQALMHHDFQWPLQFAASSPFKNSSLQMPYLSYVKRVGDSFVYSIRAITKSTNSIPVGADYLLNKPNDPANSRQLQTMCTTNFGLPLPLQMHPGTGAVSTAITTGFFGDIKVTSFAPYLNEITGTLTLPADTTFDAQ